MPPYAESFSLSIAEAEACGLFIVSYKVSGLPEEVVENQTAILVQPFNHEALAKAIIKLIQAPDQAHDLGRRGAHFMHKYFSWKKTA
jgi:glycosyltransferase involved in cell wall biosynthesis